MEDKDLDKLFQDTFINAEEAPNKSIWDKIESNLDHQNKIIPIRKKTNWWLYATAAIVLLSLGYFGFNINKNPDSIKTTEKENKIIADNSNLIPLSKTPESNISPTHFDRKVTPAVKENSIVQKNEISTASQSKRPTIQIEVLQEIKVALTNIDPKNHIVEAPTFRQVTEIGDIKPLIEFEEEEETMLATTNTDIKDNKHFVTSVLNKIAENIEPDNDKKVRFVADEEGSFGISIINSFAKNRTKKRK